jgi:NAD+--dinitrogen-reductase ADP-D-ribosyltransferase
MNEPSPRRGAVAETGPERQGTEPGRWYSTNLVGLPVGLLGSTAFNAHPQPFAISGVRGTHRGLFRLLESAGDLTAASAVFRHFMEIVFGIAPPEPGTRSTPITAPFQLPQAAAGLGLDSNSAAAPC